MAVPTREQFFDTWFQSIYAPEFARIMQSRGSKLGPPAIGSYQYKSARDWIFSGRLQKGVTGISARAPEEMLRPRFEQDYQKLLTEESQKQEQEILRQQQEADRAAKELAAEQARIQAQLQAEQQAISQQQQEQAAAIEAQLAREMQAAQAEQETLRAQFETERAQTEKLIGEAQAETQKQEVAAKREATTALNIGKQTSLAKLREQQKEATPVRLPQVQRRKTMIGQPGVTSTRVSARPSIGGYGGTTPGRVNPTGLNI